MLLSAFVALTGFFGGTTMALPSEVRAASRFKFFDIPTPLAGPCDLVTGPDGAEYVQYLFAEKIARIDPTTGSITEYSIPFTGLPVSNSSLPAKDGKAILACVIRNGKDGNIYAANGLRNQLVKFDMKTKHVTVFDPPNAISPITGNLQPLNDLWGADEGMFFSQSSANLISLFDYKTHKIRSWEVPTAASLPLGMRTLNGALWFTELAGQKIGRLDLKTFKIKEYMLPVPSLLGPAVLRVQTENRYLWFTAALSDSIGRLDSLTGEFKAYPNTAPVSAASIPSEDTKDSKGNVWFCTWTQNLLHRLDPKSGNMVHIEVPHTDIVLPVSLPFGFGIGLDYFNTNGANQIYFTQATLNRVGVYQLR